MVEFRTSLGEIIKALCRRLLFGTGQFNDALIELNPDNDTVFLKNLRERLPVGCFLVEGLLVQNGATQILSDLFASTKQEITVRATVLLRILDLDAIESLTCSK